MKKGDKIRIKRLKKAYSYLADYEYIYIEKYKRGAMTFAILRFIDRNGKIGSRININIKNVEVL